MSSRPSEPGQRTIAIALAMMVLAVVIAVLAIATAHAANYRMVLCAGNNGSNSFQTATNTSSPQNSAGIFGFENHCGPAPYPAGNNAFLRIAENQSGGTAGVNAYGSISWTVPPWVAIIAGGGYTREPGEFKDGWRGRFWAEDWGGGTNNILLQGTHAENSGINWSPTSTFAAHLWPFTGFGDYRRFVFELTCFRQGGCDRTGLNAVDANTLVLTLADRQDSQTHFTDGSALMSGDWVRGPHALTWNAFDQGSGLRWERLRVDGAERRVIDHLGSCDIDSAGASGEFARQFQPCPIGGPYDRSYTLDTASISDGVHTIQICAQDYAQAIGLDGTGSESCDQRAIRVDNTAPGKPASLRVTSSNPARYLDRFGASFSLPPNQGSPIVRVHYQVVNSVGEVVKPEKVITATNPTGLSGIEGPEHPGDYGLRVWLEDQVGFSGPAVEVPIPHDTTPPAAPQELRVVGGTSHWVPTISLRWNNLVDDGAPIDTAHYEVVRDSAQVVAPTRAVSGNNLQAIEGIKTPPQVGEYKIRVWLSDAEGNVGARSEVAVPRDTTPPAAPQDLSIVAPGSSRAGDSFDVHWRNLIDDGSPIDAARYSVIDASGTVVVPTTTVGGSNIEAIANLNTPRNRGLYTLLLRLVDAEGNVGAPASAPLAYNCVKGDKPGAVTLTAGLGMRGAGGVLRRQGRGATLRGRLDGAGGAFAGVPICVFSQVVTDAERSFVGVALTDANGGYEFPIAAGPSRELTAIYRPGQRELSAHATLRTRVRPSLRLARKVVRNKRVAVFRGRIPGPHAGRVVVVLQVKSGRAWRVFRRYRTRANGRFVMRYRFTQTPTPTVYVVRVQVGAQRGYPYEAGNSRTRRLRVVPSTSRARRAHMR